MTPSDHRRGADDPEGSEPSSERRRVRVRPPRRATGRPVPAPGAGAGDAGAGESAAEGPSSSPLDAFETGVEKLRGLATELAEGDAAADVPRLNMTGRAESEAVLAERCRAFYRSWQSRERRRLSDGVGGCERWISDGLGAAELALDRFDRILNDLRRLKDRIRARREEEGAVFPGQEYSRRGRRMRTGIYLPALVFLALVELFANAPVFTALLPRDAGFERRVRLLAEGSEGWLAGAEQALGQLLLRPDAALLAAGVVTFLLLLAHFFGHSLRGLVIRRDRPADDGGDPPPSRLEHAIPMLLSGVGLVLVLAVLYQARVTLGELGERRYEAELAEVTELQREASARRAAGDLLEAASLESRGEELEAEAEAAREYALTMSGLALPILFLNGTLVLCAISAAYFHHRDPPRYLDEAPFERRRGELIEAGEETAGEVSSLLSGLARHLHDLRSLLYQRSITESQALVHELEAVITAYRTENARLRGLDPRRIPAFESPAALDLDAGAEAERGYPSRSQRNPDEYERQRNHLTERFEQTRERFTREAIGW